MPSIYAFPPVPSIYHKPGECKQMQTLEVSCDSCIVIFIGIGRNILNINFHLKIGFLLT